MLAPGGSVALVKVALPDPSSAAVARTVDPREKVTLPVGVPPVPVVLVTVAVSDTDWLRLLGLLVLCTPMAVEYPVRTFCVRELVEGRKLPVGR